MDGSGDDDDAGFLNSSEDEDAILSSVMPQTNAPAALLFRSVFFEVCERAAAHFNIEWQPFKVPLTKICYLLVTRVINKL